MKATTTTTRPEARCYYCTETQKERNEMAARGVRHETCEPCHQEKMERMGEMNRKQGSDPFTNTR